MYSLFTFLKEKILLNQNTGILEAAIHLLVSIGFVVFCFILDIILMIVSSVLFFGEITININTVDEVAIALISFCLPSMLCFSLFPIFVTKKIRKRSANEVGLVIVSSNRSIVIKLTCILIYIVCSTVLFLNHDFQQAIIVFVVFFFVGVNEEILVRGVLYNILCDKFKPMAAAVIASFIFAFILHSGGEFSSNICIRFPLSIFLFIIYSKSGDIYSSMLLHMSYNIIVNSI